MDITLGIIELVLGILSIASGFIIYQLQRMNRKLEKRQEELKVDRKLAKQKIAAVGDLATATARYLEVELQANGKIAAAIEKYKKASKDLDEKEIEHGLNYIHGGE